MVLVLVVHNVKQVGGTKVVSDANAKEKAEAETMCRAPRAPLQCRETLQSLALICN